MKPGSLQIELMCELERLCYPETEAYDTYTMQEFLREPGMVLVCEWREGMLVGFQLSDRKRASIITIDVHPAYRRQGIGRFLMLRSLHILKAFGLKQISSQVAVDNIPSLMLHFKFGFKIRHRLRNYYGFGKDAYLLVLQL